MSSADIAKRNRILEEIRQENAVFDLIAYCHKTNGETPDYGEIAQALWRKEDHETLRNAILVVSRLKAKGRLRAYVTHRQKLVVRLIR